MATPAALSNYAENELLDHLLGTGAFTQPAGTWLQLHTADPGEDCTAAVAAFTTRTQVTAWDAAAGLASANTNALAITGFSTAETISHYSVWDAATAGNPLLYGDLTTARPVDTGFTLTFAAGDIDPVLSGNLTNYSGNGLLNHLLGNTALASPTNVYVQMHLGAPGLDGDLNVAALNTRSLVGAFGAASGGAASNSGVVALTGAASELITNNSFHDALTGGNALLQGPLGTSRAVTNGEALEYAAGAIQVSLT